MQKLIILSEIVFIMFVMFHPPGRTDRLTSLVVIENYVKGGCVLGGKIAGASKQVGEGKEQIVRD